MHIDNLLVGDIFHISTGEILPVDCILIEGNSIQIYIIIFNMSMVYKIPDFLKLLLYNFLFS